MPVPHTLRLIPSRHGHRKGNGLFSLLECLRLLRPMAAGQKEPREVARRIGDRTLMPPRTSTADGHLPGSAGNLKDFARRFPVERAAFLASAQGSFAPEERERWLSSVLARLMFLRFLRERPRPQAQVPDEAIERLFTFFDSYQWEIDESSAAAGNALTPEVLGRTFEQQADQKRTGSYYTAADVTAYITRGSLLSFLLGEAASRCPRVFGPNGLAARLLRGDPDRYLSEAVRKGVGLP